MRPSWPFWGLLVAAAVALSACSASPPEPDADQKLESNEVAETVIGWPKVIDGDTLHLVDRRPVVKIRLAQLDAPELGQPGGEEAAARLFVLAGGWVRCELTGETSYDRVIGICFNRWGQDLQAQLIREGLARQYWRFGNRYATEEAAARAAKRGIWAK